jgi:hypothetical protein
MPDSRDNAVSLSTLPPDHSPLPTGSSNILSGFLEPIENSVCTTVVYSPRAASQTVADLLQSDTESLDPNASLPQAATDWSTGERSSTLPCDAEDGVIMTVASDKDLLHHGGVRSTSEASLDIGSNV